MNNERKVLIEYRLSRAEETLEDAKILFVKRRLFSTVNRIYYAIFYAVNALLLSKNLSSAKHSGVLSLFMREFVNKGIVNQEMGKFYNQMFEFRQKGDYKDLVEFNRDDVQRWLNKANEFISQMSCLIKEVI